MADPSNDSTDLSDDSTGLSDDSKDDILYKRSKEFIKSLREEASSAKSCVTQYTFQSLVVSGAALSFIVSNYKNNVSSLKDIGTIENSGDLKYIIGSINDISSVSTIAAIPMILILVVMMRIAMYKYEIANRAYGYELYLKTISSLSLERDKKKQKFLDKDIKYWKFVVEHEDWEKTYFVWKILYPSLFRQFYHINFYNKIINFLDINAYTVKEEKLKLLDTKPIGFDISEPIDKKTSTWFLSGRDFNPELQNFTRKENDADFYAGGYLTKMLDVISVMQVFLALPLVFSFWNLAKNILSKYNNGELFVQYIVVLLITLIAYFFIPHQISIIQEKRADKNQNQSHNKKSICKYLRKIYGSCKFMNFRSFWKHCKSLFELCKSFSFKYYKSLFDHKFLRLTTSVINIACILAVLSYAKLFNYVDKSNYAINFKINDFIAWKSASYNINDLTLLTIASIGIATVSYISYIMTARILRRQRILETGFNSIRTSSILWSIVFKIHYDSWQGAQCKIQENPKLSLFDFEELYKFHVFKKTDDVIKEMSETTILNSKSRSTSP
jgi:hypothetical protein